MNLLREVLCVFLKFSFWRFFYLEDCLAYSCKVGPSSSLTIDSSLLLFLWRILLVNEVNVLITLLGVYVTSRPPASAALP